MLKAINPFLLLETANKIIIIISAKYQIRVIRGFGQKDRYNPSSLQRKIMQMSATQCSKHTL